MTQLNALLELRNRMKESKPDFIRQDYQRRKRLGRKLKWRKPKGIHSKIRHHFKGRRKMPSPGYKSPKKVKQLHASGSKMISIFSADDVAKIKKESECIIIPKTIGMKKRLEILRKAKELNVAVLNFDIVKQIQKIENFIDSKKKKATPEVKKEAKEEKEIEIEKPKEEIKLSDAEKKDAEKKEKDKVLTKRS